MRLTSHFNHVNLSLRQSTRYLPGSAIVGNAEVLAGAEVAANALRAGVSTSSSLSEISASLPSKIDQSGSLLS